MNSGLSVLVVGAGPVGMAAAALLAEAGMQVTVLEREAHVSHEWRASTFHPPTLEHLERLDIVQDMVSQGLIADHYQIRDRERGLVADFDYKHLRGDTRYPFRLQLEQYKLVELLTARLAGSDRARVLLGHEVVDLRQDGSGVTVTASIGAGSSTFHADYVIGADGASSTVRKLLGLQFEGWTYEQRFLLMSMDLPFERYLPDLCYVNYIADPHEFVMLLRIPETWRVLVPVPPSMSDEVARDRLRMRTTIEQIIGEPVDWQSTRLTQHQLYRIHQRVVARMREGRVLLVGDAAHVNSPIGGFGLNSGLHDAFDLALRLERIANGTSERGEAAELDAFSDVRRRVAQTHIQRMSEDNTRTLTQADAQSRLMEQERLASIVTDPVQTREWLLNASLINAVRAQPLGV
ncbi:MAG TPA: NAD(P)/FAD-dependent oxidoreductase [Trebonia sp.]